MFRRLILGFVVVGALLLVFAAPARAGGWAVVTLDALPQAVHAGQPFQLGFVVRQHGKTPTNITLDGQPLVPILTARRQAAQKADSSQTIQATARPIGAVGHYVVDITLPDDGVWEWQISVPSYYVQNTASGNEGDAAILAPLTVLPALLAPAPVEPAAPVPAAPALLGLGSTDLRWAGVILLLLLALGVGLYSRRGRLGRRPAARL